MLDFITDRMFPTRFAVLTTCNAAGWELYGRRMVTTFDRYWPAGIPLYLYAEDFAPDHARPLVRGFPPWFDAFKARHAGNARAHGMVDGGYDFHFDCVRFAHKVAAVTEAASALSCDVLIWADADIVTHAPIDARWLKALFPPGPYIAWLERERHYPECGFYMLRCRHPQHQAIMARWRGIYETDAVLELAQTHDSYVWQQVVNQAENEGLITTHSLSGSAFTHRHPLINGPLGERLDHLKGVTRKTLGQSPLTDLMAQRQEQYWCKNR